MVMGRWPTCRMKTGHLGPDFQNKALIRPGKAGSIRAARSHCPLPNGRLVIGLMVLHHDYSCLTLFSPAERPCVNRSRRTFGLQLYFGVNSVSSVTSTSGICRFRPSNVRRSRVITERTASG